MFKRIHEWDYEIATMISFTIGVALLYLAELGSLPFILEYLAGCTGIGLLYTTIILYIICRGSSKI